MTNKIDSNIGSIFLNIFMSKRFLCPKVYFNEYLIINCVVFIVKYFFWYCNYFDGKIFLRKKVEH